MKQNRLQRMFLSVLLLCGFIAFIPGITLPMMTVKKMVLVQNTFTVLSGIRSLLTDKTFALGLMLLIFSVLFPLMKFIAMAAYVIAYPTIPTALVHWQHTLSKLAKFSMLDVFFIAQMLMMLKLGWLVEIRIHSGIYWFSAAVILSVISGVWIESDIKIRLKNA